MNIPVRAFRSKLAYYLTEIGAGKILTIGKMSIGKINQSSPPAPRVYTTQKMDIVKCSKCLKRQAICVYTGEGEEYKICEHCGRKALTSSQFNKLKRL